MTIERRAFPLRGLLLALAAWFGGMAAAAYAFDPAAVVVFAPGGGAAEVVAAADGVLLAAGAGYATARSDRPGFTRRLYAGGASFVWPALGRTCSAAAGPTR